VAVGFSKALRRPRDLPLAFDVGDFLITSVSSTGKRIMVNRFNPRFNLSSHISVFDDATLTLRKSWDQSPRLYHDYSISENEIAAVQQSGIATAEFGQAKWTVIGAGVGHCDGNVPFLFATGILVYGCSELIASLSSGQIVMKEAYPDDERASAKKAAARDRPLVAVSLDTIEKKCSHRNDRAHS
jgi:hypothetical protein